MIPHITPEEMTQALMNNDEPLINYFPEQRKQDAWGNGEFGALRGSRTHNGIDYLIEAGSIILAPCSGVISKHGLCYRGDEYRYVQITDKQGNLVRLFYVEPVAPIGKAVMAGTPIGYMQELGIRYHPIRDQDGKITRIVMPNHCHLEVMRGEIKPGESKFIDPSKYNFKL